MSRIGKHAVTIPTGVEVSIAGQEIDVKGKLGSLSRRLAPKVAVSHEQDTIVVKPRDDSLEARAQWGLTRTLVNNMVRGVSEGYSRTLEISGVGFRAAVDGRILNLQLGFSHEIKMAMPEGITVKCARPTEISLRGPDRELVGQIAAEIRSLRKPEPYKGKGIKYAEEKIRRKEGKKK